MKAYPVAVKNGCDEIKEYRITKHPTDPCSHLYPGSRAFRSPEVNDIANGHDHSNPPRTRTAIRELRHSKESLLE